MTLMRTVRSVVRASAAVLALLLMIRSEARAQECEVTCPANITQSNDADLCGAAVNYPAPTTVGSCGTVTCLPASGSFFEVGTTTVTCTSQEGPSCFFTVTVNDTEPPTITCPDNIDVPTRTLPVIANFPAPTASDNCPGVTVACVPPSGSSFDVGETIVTCTATDNSGNTATCSFLVRVLLQTGVPALSFIGLMALAIAMAAVGMARRRRI